MDVSLLLGFSGSYRDTVTGAYPLGNGYRAYLPQLMRFNAPDNWSPFGAGGVNPYAYCDDDPINNVDPSGHNFVSAATSAASEAITETGEASTHDLAISARHAVSVNQQAGDGIAQDATMDSTRRNPASHRPPQPGIRRVKFAKSKEIRVISDDEFYDRTAYPKRSKVSASKLLRADLNLETEEVQKEFKKFLDYAAMQMQIADERVAEVNALLKNNFRGNLKREFDVADIALADARAAIKDAVSLTWKSRYYIDIELDDAAFTLQRRYKNSKRLLPNGLPRQWHLFKARFL